jgi:hypothetical protein
MGTRDQEKADQERSGGQKGSGGFGRVRESRRDQEGSREISSLGGIKRDQERSAVQMPEVESNSPFPEYKRHRKSSDEQKMNELFHNQWKLSPTSVGTSIQNKRPPVGQKPIRIALSQ